MARGGGGRGGDAGRIVSCVNDADPNAKVEHVLQLVVDALPKSYWEKLAKSTDMTPWDWVAAVAAILSEIRPPTVAEEPEIAALKANAACVFRYCSGD